MKEILDGMKGITYLASPLTVKSSTVNREALEGLADMIAKDVLS